MSEEQQSQHRASMKALLKESFIHQQESSLPIRILKKVDIFSFIPVPKDDPVSTKHSLVGTAVFFVIFLAYIIFDFYQFATANPPMAQNFYTNLGDDAKPLPRFAIAYMRGQKLNQTGTWDQYLTFKLSQQSKDKGQESKDQIDIYVNNFTKEHNGLPNDDQIDWIDADTKSFYNILMTSSKKNLNAKGLLYSTSNATYGKIKIQMCNFSIPQLNCKSKAEIEKFCAEGRIFLFIENIYDTTDFSKEDELNTPKFFIYNFFLQPYIYKRIIFNFQAVETVVEPDYFFRFTRQKQPRLQIASYIEQGSNVVLNAKQDGLQALDMIGIQFQLAPQILNVRVTYRTLIDHISMWGAFWGVLFALFALFFLTYNRKKFYKRNPGWDKFKKNNLIAHQEYHEQSNQQKNS